jgi:hypothetical protein
MRSLLAAGQVEYLCSADPAVTPALFEIYQGIERRSWKSGAGTAIGRDPHWNASFGELLEAHQPMLVSIHIVLLDGVPVAGLITGAFGEGLYALDIVFDDSLRRLAPGSAVLLMGLRQAINGRFTFLNLLSGFAYFKLRWQADMSGTCNAQIYRVGTPFYWRRVFGDLNRWLRATPAPPGAALSNPARAEATAVVRAPALHAAELQRIAALIARARQGRGEFLSAAQLAALMPFAARRTGAGPDRTIYTSQPAGPPGSTAENDPE